MYTSLKSIGTEVYQYPVPRASGNLLTILVAASRPLLNVLKIGDLVLGLVSDESAVSKLSAWSRTCLQPTTSQRIRGDYQVTDLGSCKGFQFDWSAEKVTSTPTFGKAASNWNLARLAPGILSAGYCHFGDRHSEKSSSYPTITKLFGVILKYRELQVPCNELNSKTRAPDQTKDGERWLSSSKDEDPIDDEPAIFQMSKCESRPLRVVERENYLKRQTASVDCSCQWSNILLIWLGHSDHPLWVVLDWCSRVVPAWHHLPALDFFTLLG